jgi:cell division protein FtsQ
MARNDSAPDEPRNPAHPASGDEFTPRSAARRGAPVVRESVKLNDEEDDFDSRLVDLDMEEESPFLRAQRRVPVRRGPLPRRAAQRLRLGLFWGASVGVVLLAGFAVYNYGARSWRFRLPSADNISTPALRHVTRTQMIDVFAADIGRNVFFIPLEDRRRQLERIPWVRSATVMRLLPDRIAVSVQERTPVAFAQVGARIHLIDLDGVLVDLPPASQERFSFPVLVGMAESEPISTRAARMAVYDRVVRALDGGGAHYSAALSEIDVTDPEDVRVTVGDDAGAVMLHLGNTDFLERFKLYQAHVQEWRQKFQKLESVDLRYERQVIVNPDPAVASAKARAKPAASTLKPAPQRSKSETRD